jgi:hypothetical protein
LVCGKLDKFSHIYDKIQQIYRRGAMIKDGKGGAKTLIVLNFEENSDTQTSMDLLER